MTGPVPQAENRRSRSILVLGGGKGWHAGELARAAEEHGCPMEFADYESLTSRIVNGRVTIDTIAGKAHHFAAIITRTMPAGTLDQITFRLAMLHDLRRREGVRLINAPEALEIAIDKYATLAVVSGLGYPVPDTIVGQDRAAAMAAFDTLGGDVVVKPIFGGEGRGVMRVQDRELAWTTFSTLEHLGAVIYVQRFVRPGGVGRRLFVIGDQVFGVRRHATDDFRTNAAAGGHGEPFDPSIREIELATTVIRRIGLDYAAVDLIEDERGGAWVIEVNAVPGWRALQTSTNVSVAKEIVRYAIGRPRA